MAALNFYTSIGGGGSSSGPLFLHLPAETADRPAEWSEEDLERAAPSAWAALWQMAETLAAALWTKNIPMGALCAMWDIVCDSMSTIDPPGGRSVPPKLITRLGDRDGSCPGGITTVQQLVEGFAKYREVMELSVHLPFHECVEPVAASMRLAEYRGSSDYVREKLGIPFFHPLSGALHDLALRVFPDPFFIQEDELLWEEIHPGRRFQRAVDRLAISLRAVPERQDNAYPVATDAFGLNESMLDQEFRSTLATVLDSPDYVAPRDVRWSGDDDFFACVRRFFQSVLLNGLDLRSRYPDVYYSPQSYGHPVLGKDRTVWNRFVEETSPFFIANTDKIKVWAHDDAVGVGIVMAALHAQTLDDLARYGTLRTTLEIVKLVSQSELFDVDMIDHTMGLVLGDIFDEKLRALVAGAAIR